VRVHDADAGRARAVAAAIGAEAAPDLGALARGCDVVFSCVPTNDVVRAVYLGPGGIAAAMRAGGVTVDCSTIGPEVTLAVHEALAARGVAHLDASMLGSVRQAEEGAISFVVGGDAPAFARAEPLLRELGRLVRRVGGPGAGNRLKLAHQTLVAANAVAVAEALALCLETGVDVETFHDVIVNGTGMAHSRYLENRVPRMRAGDFSPLFALKFMAKDARLARDMAPALADKLPLLRAAIATLEEGEKAGFGDDDFSAAMKVLERRTGRRVAK
jgi:3-hydroxyisobutyrate dehydrogenase-like beta-hydroxyacid dehydrogenase